MTASTDRLTASQLITGKQGPDARCIDGDADVADVIALLPLTHDRATG